MAPLHCAAKFDPFLSLGKEGIKFCHLATLFAGMMMMMIGRAFFFFPAANGTRSLVLTLRVCNADGEGDTFVVESETLATE